MTTHLDTGSLRLSDKVALVTGSTSGIGEAIAAAFAAEGALVIMSGRNRERGARAVATIQAAGGKAHFVECDLGGDPLNLATAATEVAGGIDILVHNAAQLATLCPTADITPEDIDCTLATNVKAPILLTGALAPHMQARGGGSIINIGTVNALTGMAGTALYSASKAALHSLTLSWAAEYGRRGVRVNLIIPGPVATESNLARGEHFDALLAKTTSGRMSDLSEIADATLFLASDAASNIHGAALTVDGGFLAATRVTP